MNQLQDSPARAGDPIDEVLRAFFRQQIPQRWPAVPLPPAPATPLLAAARSSRNARRRLALAASVGLLVLGSMFVAGKVAPPTSVPPTLPDNARGRNERPWFKEMPKTLPAKH